MSPAQGCSEASYATSWAADKTKSVSGYPLANVAAIQADLQVRSRKGVGGGGWRSPVGVPPQFTPLH